MSTVLRPHLVPAETGFMACQQKRFYYTNFKYYSPFHHNKRFTGALESGAGHAVSERLAQCHCPRSTLAGRQPDASFAIEALS